VAIQTAFPLALPFQKTGTVIWIAAALRASLLTKLEVNAQIFLRFGLRPGFEGADLEAGGDATGFIVFSF
jgi:hypothetical protein